MDGRKCPNHKCRKYRQPTNLFVCSHCHRATVQAIYRPRFTSQPQRRRR